MKLRDGCVVIAGIGLFLASCWTNSSCSDDESSMILNGPVLWRNSIENCLDDYYDHDSNATDRYALVVQKAFRVRDFVGILELFTSGLSNLVGECPEVFVLKSKYESYVTVSAHCVIVVGTGGAVVLCEDNAWIPEFDGNNSGVLEYYRRLVDEGGVQEVSRCADYFVITRLSGSVATACGCN